VRLLLLEFITRLTGPVAWHRYRSSRYARTEGGACGTGSPVLVWLRHTERSDFVISLPESSILWKYGVMVCDR
jgi:hypothetical protein